MMSPIPVLLVCYNRLEYTKQALESIIRNPCLPIRLTIFDNASTDGTQEWLDSLQQLPSANNETIRQCRIIRNGKNVGLAPAMNRFFRDHADAPYVVKVDNDTILPDNWLADLMEVMSDNGKSFSEVKIIGEFGVRTPYRLGAVSGTCLRPPGLTAQEWYSRMPKVPLDGHDLYFNPACLGTGVLINMDMIRERGLLFEKFPRSPQSGPDDPCLISGWGAYIQEASAYTDWKFAMYSKVPVQLLNLKEDQVLSNDYPEYDAEVQKVRDEGNAWWESVGGIAGVRKYVEDHGGLEQLEVPYRHERKPFMTMNHPKGWPWDRIYDSSMLTEASNLQERSTPGFWEKRIAEHGTTKSTFLSTSQVRINEFTAIHMKILRERITGKHVLDAGCGWGRGSRTIAQMASEYIGIDFMPALIEKAQESLPDLQFAVQDVHTGLSFPDKYFDVVIAVTCLSSFAGVFPEVLKELHRVSKGEVIFLEEDFCRIDWKLENE